MQKKRSLKTIFIFLFCFPFLATGQYSDANYAKLDLVSTDVKTIFDLDFDHDGDLWIATEYGLFEFDGAKSKLIVKPGQGGLSMSRVEVDSYNRVWSADFNGNVFLCEASRLIKIPFDSERNGMIELFILENDVYAYGGKAIWKYDKQKNSFIEVARYNETVYSLFVKNQQLVAVFYREAERCAHDGETRIRCLTITSDDDLYDGNIYVSHQEDDVCLYFGHTRNSAKFENLLERNDQYTKYDYSAKVTNIKKLNKSFFVCGYDGVKIFDFSGNLKRHILRGIQVSKVDQDLNGIIYISTLNHGIYYIENLQENRIDLSKFLDDSYVNKVFLTNKTQTAYIGSTKGEFIRYSLKDQKISKLSFSSLSEVQSIYVDEDKSFALAFCDSLYRIDLNTFSIDRSYNSASIKSMNAIGNRVYLASSNGLYCYTGDFGVERITDSDWLSDVYPLNDSTLLIASKNGLFSYDSKKNSSTRIGNGKIKNAQVILRNEQKDIFVLTDYENVWKLNKNLELRLLFKSERRDLKNAIPSDEGIFLDGITKDYYIDDQSGHRLFNPIEYCDSRSLRLFLRNKNKFLLIDESSVSTCLIANDRKKSQPSLLLKIKNGTFHGTSKYLTSDFDENDFRFQLKMRHHLIGKAEFFYRLNSGEWTQVSQGELVSIQRLPVGENIVEIYGKDANGRKTSVEKIVLKVKAPYYQTWYFYFALICILLVIFFLIYKFSLHQIRKSQRKILEKERLSNRVLSAELTAIRTQMNPHFIFNVLSAIQTNVILGKKHDVYRNIGDFSALIRSILDNSGREYMSLAEELDLMENYVRLENSRLNEPIQFTIQLDENIDPDLVQIPTLITQPFIENAIKHAFRLDQKLKTIQFSVEKENEQITLLICDNGMGMHASSKKKKKGHNSFALGAMRERIEKTNAQGRFEITLDLKTNVTGTCISIKLKEKSRK